MRQFLQKSSQSLKNINLWKTAFLSLTAILIGCILFVSVRISQPREVFEIPEKEMLQNPVMFITSDKKQSNRLISFYLNDYQKDKNIAYQFLIENEVVLTGEFKVLHFPVQFYLYFDPYVTENGNIQLKAKSLSIGTLGVPIREIMKMAQKNYQLPKWIEIDPSNETIYLRLDELTMKNGMSIRADKINLVDDEIKFSLYLPKR